MNKVFSSLAVLLLFFPSVTFAQDVQTFLINFITFVNNVMIPFLLGTAFLFFIINVIRFFVIGGSNEEGRDKAKNLALYGVGAFVLIIIFWGIVNLLSSSLGLDGCSQPYSDYYKQSISGTLGVPWEVNCAP